MQVTAIDPGIHAGWALTDDRGRVSAAGHGKPAASCLWQRGTIIEKPVVYPGSKVRENDLITLAINAGRWVSVYWLYGPVYLVPARVWKGGINKYAHHVQVQAGLSKPELVLWQSLKTHDARDAFALALWAVKTLKASDSALDAYRVTDLV